MSTETARLKALVAAGLLPETAQDIIDADPALTKQPAAEAARITAADRTRARVFGLYAALVPDRLRHMLTPVDE